MGLFSGTRPRDLGVKGGKLKPPPAAPNAVSSQATGGYHQIAPLTYTGSREQALTEIRNIVESTPRTKIIVTTPDYLYAEYESRWMGYVDDVEFYFPAYEKIVHVRSASRLGNGDFGVNRRRIEDIRSRFHP